MKNILFTKKVLIAYLADWVLQLSKCIPSNLVNILNDADKWFEENKINEPIVSIPDFILYKSDEYEIYSFLKRMVEEVPSISILNERSVENKNDFIDLGALARNISNTIKWDHQRTESINIQTVNNGNRMS